MYWRLRDSEFYFLRLFLPKHLDPWAFADSNWSLYRTNPEAFKNRGFLQIVRDEGFGLYKGAGWTAARNAPGSFAVR